MAGATGRLIAAGLVATLSVAAGPAAVPDPVRALAGRYSHHFVNGDVDGGAYWSDDVVEIVPVDPSHAYFRIELAFFNGHSCGLSGIARARGARLDYRVPPDGEPAGCHMTLSHRRGRLNLDDHGGSCHASCGARGGYAAEGLPWGSRRPIRYLARLRASTPYRSALAAWRKGPTTP